ncbi:MAG: type 2 isopentenyl-diphosphate Delta-isomerase [Actinomycetia bacterium]|nr:type 2 isopentenyl-diphosphate Delta-isomerase [Actinomycetes bacterium]
MAEGYRFVRHLRQRRKAEHIDAVRALPDGRFGPWFEYVHLIPASAPEYDWADVDLSTTFCGRHLASPVLINAMTGGTSAALAINRRLARAARRYGLAMAVGSSTAALEDPDVTPTYTVVRDEYPDGVVLANVGMGTRLEAARQAVALLRADMLQVHWNAAQELFMVEGDRRFRGALAAFATVARHVGVPVIAKEVGQGLSGEAARQFAQAGAAAVDVGGAGGTNFLAVESWRQGEVLDPAWAHWGIPTAAAVVEAVAAVGAQVDVVASGGIRHALDVAKALALGAKVAGIAGPLLRLAAEPDGEARLDAYLAGLHRDLRRVLLLTGARTWTELRERPVLVLGPLREWLEARGLGPVIALRGWFAEPGPADRRSRAGPRTAARGPD